MTSVLSNPNLHTQNDVTPFLSIHIYITASDTEEGYGTGQQSWIHNAPLTIPVRISKGKPDLNLIIQDEKAQQIGAMAVSVCGPGGLSDEVRRVAREEQGIKAVDFYEASFSW